MNYTQNLNHTHCKSNNCDNTDMFALKTCLKLTKGRRNVLERNVAKYDTIKAEVRDLQLKLEDLLKSTTDTKKCFEHSQNDVNCDLEEIALKYKEILIKVDELEQNNKDLQRIIQFNTSKELLMVEKFKEMEYFNVKTSEYNTKLQNNIHNEKECELLLKQLQCDLEEVIDCKTVETNKLHCILTNKEAASWLENQKLIKIQQQNAVHDRTVEEMIAKSQVQKAELEGLIKAAQKQLTLDDQALKAAHEELVDTSATVAEWKIEAENVTKALYELKVTSDAELCCVQSMFMEHESERVQLTEQLLDASTKLNSMVIENYQLGADVKAITERTENMVVEIERLEQRKFHDRIALDIQRTKFDDEAMLQDDMKIIKQHKLAAVNNEVDVLKWACESRKQVIEDAKRKLDDNC